MLDADHGWQPRRDAARIGRDSPALSDSAGPILRPLVVEDLQDPRPQSLLELEEDPDAGQVDASFCVRWRIQRTRRMSFSL